MTTQSTYHRDALQTTEGQRHAAAHRNELDGIERQLSRINDEMAALIKKAKTETL